MQHCCRSKQAWGRKKLRRVYVVFCAGWKFVQEGLGRWAAGWEAPGRQDERNP